LLTSYLLWPRYATSSLRSRLRYRLQIAEISRKEKQTKSIFKLKIRHIDDPASELANKGFLFVENFLEEDSYKILVENWPKKRWFEPLMFRQNGKSYDSGLCWDESKKRFDSSILHNPAIYEIYTQLRSRAFSENITEICKDGIERSNLSLKSTESYSHSYLTPHQDSMDPDNELNDSLMNIIFFVEANGGGWEAGGTSIFADATFNKPILIPQNLNNSALLYRTSEQVWHGFPRIKFHKYRKTILAHYWSTAQSLIT